MANLRRVTPGIAPVLLLAACASAPPEPPPPARSSSMVDATTDGMTPTRALTSRVTAILPARVDTATLRDETAMRQQPRLASAAIATLAAGTVVQKLGDIRNSDGDWVSVAVSLEAGDGQGWIRAEALPP